MTQAWLNGEFRGRLTAMPRPVWSGTISFGLVAIPIKMFHAVSKKSVSFNQLDERTMSRIRLKKVSAETGEDVPDENIVKGYEISKGRYVIVDPDDLEPFIPSATKSIDLEEFVDLDEIDPVYFDSPYILAPDKTPKPYALLAQAMEAAGKVAIGRFVMRNKQYVAAVRASEGTLLMSTMVFADEVVKVESIDELEGLDEIDISSKEVKMKLWRCVLAFKLQDIYLRANSLRWLGGNRQEALHTLLKIAMNSSEI